MRFTIFGEEQIQTNKGNMEIPANICGSQMTVCSFSIVTISTCGCDTGLSLSYEEAHF